MVATALTEKEALLRLCKDFTTHYNPSTLAQAINKSRYGTFKALKALEEDGIIRGKNYGKARFYTINDDDYALKNVELLLMEEAKHYNKWQEEFKELASHCDLIILFGSLLRSEKQASDIDLLLVFEENNNQLINTLIEEKNNLLTKKVHPIKQTPDDIRKMIQQQNKVILEAIRTGIVLHGHENYVRLINACHKHATKWTGV